jgi:hypothetical protein
MTIKLALQATYAVFRFLKFQYMYRIITLWFIFLMVGFSAVAQSDYLVTLKSDTLKGEARILSYDKLDRAQISINGKKEVYTALQILSLQMDSVFYKAIQIDNTVRLMKVLRSGYLSLYAFKLPNQSTYEGRYMVKMDGTSLEVPNISFKRLMANYLEDCKEVADKIKNGDFPKKDLEKIIDEYNVCVTQLKPDVEVPPAVIAQKEAIQHLSKKIKELKFDTKGDALDILRDMQTKVEKQEKVSNYLIEGLQTALKDQSSLSEELDKLIVLLKE